MKYRYKQCIFNQCLHTYGWAFQSSFEDCSDQFSMGQLDEETQLSR